MRSTRAAAACLFLSAAITACSGAPTGPSANVVGRWVGTLATQEYGVGSTQTLSLDIRRAKTFTEVMDLQGLVLARLSGTWAIDGTNFVGTTTACREINSAGTLKDVPCGLDHRVRLPLTGIAGNTWRVRVGEGTVTFARQ